MISQWNLMRFLRAGLAAWAFFELYRTGEWLLLFPGVIFGLQAVLNTGCCGNAACATGHQPGNSDYADPACPQKMR